MSKRDDQLLVQDMLEAAKKIVSYTQGLTFKGFQEDAKTVDAVIRNFEVLGEAASRLYPDFQKKHSSIPWNKLKGYRNRLIHEYFGIDHQIVWDIISDDLKPLILELERLMD